jgi:deoxyxylulose-5-phosphate synthase
MHLPSSLSHLYYLDYLFTNNIVTQEMNIIIGKPFGADAYYYTWKKNNWIKPEDKYSYGIKHNELSFVNFSEETLGNALGVAAGIALTSSKISWVNISDAALQMGPTLEAIRFIGQKNLNIKLTIDYNNMKLTSSLKLKTHGLKHMFEDTKWHIVEITSKSKYHLLKQAFNLPGPVCIIIHTKKGDGVKEMEEDPIGWHYKELKDLNEITISEELKDLGFFTSLGYVE